MAIAPHCAVCDFSAGNVAGSVEFADHIAGDRGSAIYDQHGNHVLGSWTPPQGIQLFCREHLKRAEKLRYLPAVAALEMIRTGADLSRRRRLAAWFRAVLARKHS